MTQEQQDISPMNINIPSTQDTEVTNMSSTGLGFTQEYFQDESLINGGIMNCINKSRVLQKNIKDKKLIPLLKRFEAAGETAGD